VLQDPYSVLPSVLDGVELDQDMIGIVAIALLLSGTLVCADQKGVPIAQAGIKEFTKAFEKWDASGFAAAAGLFQEACALDPAATLTTTGLG